MKYRFLTALGLLAAATSVGAAETPIVTFNTSIYETYGSANSFHLVIGGTPGQFIDVDYGYGPVEVELQEMAVVDGVVTGATVTCSVSPQGMVKIYGNPADIHYFDAEGCYIRSIDLSQLTALEGLDLAHNELRSLDLSPNTRLQAVTVSDNPFTEATPLVIGREKPDLMLLEMSMIDWLSPTFNLSDYPSMISFEAYSCPTLTSIDPTGCPALQRLTVDVTPIETVDLSRNPMLLILNVADTRVTSLDLSANTKLQQLYCGHDGHAYSSYKIKELDLSHNPDLYYLFCSSNALTALDLSHNPELFDLSANSNLLTSLDLSANTKLYNVSIRRNDMGFATLPADPGTWAEYNYDQRPTAVARSFRTGDVLDLSAKMLRAGTTTTAALWKHNTADFDNPLPVDAATYSYADGKITFLAEMPDSVFAVFTNDRFDAAEMRTTNFVVKSPEAYGAPTRAVRMIPAASDGSALSFTVAVTGTAFSVDFGDGNPVAYTATPGIDTYVSGTRLGSGYVNIYVPEGTDLSTFAIEGQKLYSIDLGGAPVLRHLKIHDAGIYSLDLAQHRCLQSIDLTGNNLSTFSIAGTNINYNKTILTDLSVPRNNISTFLFDGLDGIHHLDISGNRLEELNLATAAGTLSINASGNLLTSADLLKCDALQSINLADNRIAEITLPEMTLLDSLDISGNAMSIATLPAPALITHSYIYDRQKPLTLPAKGPGANLSSQQRTIGVHNTAFRWMKADGSPVDPADYSVSGGKTRFINTSLGNVYCIITHPAFPALSLTTTEMLVAPVPDRCIASFTTPKGNEKVDLSLASTAAQATLYFNWAGDGLEFDIYDLTSTYRSFEAKTVAGAQVKVFAYEDVAPVSVFSITGATMSDIDITPLTQASTINIKGAGLTDITLPPPGHLTELFLSGNRLSVLDLSTYSDIYYLALDDNAFEGNFDFSVLPNLQLASISNNRLSSATFDNPLLWALDMSRNLFETVDLSGAPALEQIGLSGNSLSALDLSAHTGVKSLFVDNNRFTFSTLPATAKVPILYIYSNQARVAPAVEGLKADLAFAGATEVRWFIDEPWLDENGAYAGEELVAGEEYTVTDGVTTFASPFNRLVGVLTNPAFPSLNLLTEMISVSGSASVAADSFAASGIAGAIVIKAPAAARAAIYTPAGTLAADVALTPGINTVSNLAPGIYIAVIDSQTFKVAVR